ncbi:cation:proton antiporter [Marvinbryantia sp.]|uniref:cation:proton antiporter n=1 Tax=Marvinbryantia sp. TaxID=2496532 RepID=UPI0025ED2B63|nr:monovalent cation/H(+) antiporter subunit G [uncultured Marvinbryantia sp.]
MEILKWTQFILGTGMLLLGLFTFVVQILGVFKFKYVLNRMHAAAMGDTLGIGISLIGLMILSGFNFTTLKMGLVVVFLWCASPVSSHLISRLEATTNPHLDNYCEVSDEIKEYLEEENNEAKEEV